MKDCTIQCFHTVVPWPSVFFHLELIKVNRRVYSHSYKINKKCDKNEKFTSILTKLEQKI
ncbi:hypothetical protein BpHYR1_022938 [Brachionus plicatilis]|uniref:Uncharacterized protein n=1 Tax=Brachionus plicatilis TaxID=10195 RepID=A0A3M7PYQ0_BRAPC|nr:hypothetical protein BpHYR1_022938 [Brachionus plicatilis]